MNEYDLVEEANDKL